MTERTDLPLTSRSLPIAMLRARENMMAPIRQMLNKAGVTRGSQGIPQADNWSTITA